MEAKFSKELGGRHSNFRCEAFDILCIHMCIPLCKRPQNELQLHLQHPKNIPYKSCNKSPSFLLLQFYRSPLSSFITCFELLSNSEPLEFRRNHVAGRARARGRELPRCCGAFETEEGTFLNVSKLRKRYNCMVLCRGP